MCCTRAKWSTVKLLYMGFISKDFMKLKVRKEMNPYALDYGFSVHTRIRFSSPFYVYPVNKKNKIDMWGEIDKSSTK